MKKKVTNLLLSLMPMLAMAQGWPQQYQGVMLQGFYWDSYDETSWKKLTDQAKDMEGFISLLWLPQSGNCGGKSMGYDDLYWFNDYNSSFGTEAELRNLIETMKNHGIGTIADVVINHRKNLTNWVDFPLETYNGVTYQLKSTDICADDDGGATQNWAETHGYQLSSNKDTGEDWSGCRDLDHNSSNVQENVKAYLKFLLNDLGYVGFRYDMVKGYAGSFTGLYNTDAKPTYSVGEYWDGNTSTLQYWLNSTKKNNAIQSACFDFAFRYTMRDAINGSNWAHLGKGGLATNRNYQRYAVTFIENHDTEYRSSSNQQDPIRSDTIAANAFMLAMPGTPCVFYKHWLECKNDIKKMIDLRNFCGINNQSEYKEHITGQASHYAVITTGSERKLLAVVGKNANIYSPDNSWVKTGSGYHWAYYLEKATETAWATLPSGIYEEQMHTQLIAVSNSSTAKLVYTFDGSMPTAQSTAVNSGTEIEIPYGDIVMKVGLLVNGQVSGVIERHYINKEFQPHDITVYVNVDNVGWNFVNFWTWGGDGTHAPANTQWPGDKKTTTTTIAERQWYSANYHMNNSSDCVNFVFSTGNGSPQTIDISSIKETSFFEVINKTSSNKYLVNNVTDQITGINTLIVENTKSAKGVYSLDGRYLGTTTITLAPGIYVVNGKKTILQ